MRDDTRQLVKFYRAVLLFLVANALNELTGRSAVDPIQIGLHSFTRIKN